MSGTNPIDPRSPLGLMLSADSVPDLSPGFADRVLAAAETRTAPLPEPRRVLRGRGWRMGRRIAIVATGFGALATAAAATGLLNRLDLPLPSPQKVWANLTGEVHPAPVAASRPAAIAVEEAVSQPRARVAIEGPVDTPAELEEAFRRIDEVRAVRKDTRRQQVNGRIDDALARRRAAGLPVPSAEEEARLRAQLEDNRARLESAAAGRIEARRTQLREQVEGGQPLTRDDLLPGPGVGEELATPRLRDLPLEERRARLREWREHRAGRLAPAPADSDSPADTPGPTSPDQ